MMDKTLEHYKSIVIDNYVDITLPNPPVTWINISYKTYPRFRQIPLSINFSEKGKDIFKLIKKRKTRRDFKKQITFKELSSLLYFSSGIKDYKKVSKQDIHNPEFARRHYASGGARYPIEVYVVVNKVKNLDSGLYHFNIKNNTLEELPSKLLRRKKIIVDSSMNRNVAALIILTSVIVRDEVKYLNLSYPLSWEEAGRIGDRLQLLAENYDIKCCPIAGIYHNKIIDLLNIDPEEEIPLMVHAIGK